MESHRHNHDHGTTNRGRPLALALAITSIYFIAEVVGGILTNSLALLSDAGHMFSDIAALALSLVAFRVARRPITTTRTFGYHRFEILAALLNGLTLWLIVGAIFHAAYHRISDPPEVQSVGMLVVATIGLVVNVTAGLILYGSQRESLNIRGAFLHVVGDALGSVGAIAAGLIMLLTEWYLADPIISIFIGVIILYTSWELVKDSVNILLQGVPKEIELDKLKLELEQINGVTNVHDLHVWAVTSGVFTISVHAVVEKTVANDHVLERMERLLADRFHIHHSTIQIEHQNRESRELTAF
ncbi:MAG: cation diffusion facilitator family transporter [Candidatus Binatia bacterium]